jgi:adenosine deaminase
VDELSGLAKVELHLHLDISMSYRVAAQLVDGLTREDYVRRLQGPRRCASLADFLAGTREQVALLQTPRALDLLARDVVGALAGEGTVYAEVRFAPLLHTEQGMAPEEAVETVVAAASEAAATHEIDVGVIVCALRHFTTSQSVRTGRLAARFHGQGVVGFDLAGAEADFPLAPHLPAFAVADDAGVPYTVHAGEAGGPASVREVLDTLGPSRIGHGVRSVEDPALVDRLAAAGTHLEVCPTCNVQLQVFPTLPEHPVDALYRRGISLGISTDSRTSTPTTLPDEYAALATTFGWQRADFVAVNRMAADASFAPDDTRARVRRLVLAG